MCNNSVGDQGADGANGQPGPDGKSGQDAVNVSSLSCPHFSNFIPELY